MKVITIVGTIGRDCEVRENKGGEFATFSVAVNKGYSRDAGTDWFQVNYYNTKLAQYLTKGKKVVVSGSLDIVEKDGRTFYNIRANQVEFAGDAKPREQVQHTEHSSPSPQMQPSMAEMDDEIPF
jgi:single-stranded DNA-binding protein